MKILALEMSTARGSVALVFAGAIVFEAAFANDRKHSGDFFARLDTCIAEFGAPDRIVVGLGPGSYAGSRIAIAAANGLQAATAADLLGRPSICALATDALEYVAIGDARRQSFYFAHVRHHTAVEGPLLLSETDLRERLASTELPVLSSERLPAFPQASVAYPSAALLVQCAAELGGASDLPLEPIYLRDPHITQPRAAVARS